MRVNLFERLIEPRQKLPEPRKLFTDSMLKVMIIPLLIEQLLQMLVGLADTMMVSYAGEKVVAGDHDLHDLFFYTGKMA